MTKNINAVLLTLDSKNKRASVFKLGDYFDLNAYLFDLERRFEENEIMIKKTLEELGLPEVEHEYSLLSFGNMNQADRRWFEEEALNYTLSNKSYELYKKYSSL